MAVSPDLSELPTGYAVKAFVVADNAILAVRRSAADMNYAGQWDLPGGHMEAGETEIDALKREVWEETGLTVGIAPEAFTETMIAHPPKTPTRRIHVSAYLAIAADDAGAPVMTNQVASDYIDKIKWIAFEDLAETKFIASLRPLIDVFTAKYVATSEVAA